MKNYLICFLAIVTPLLFGCEKETLSDDASNAFHTLKDLGIKTSNMKFISSGGLIFDISNMDAFVDVICVLKGLEYNFFIIRHIYDGNDETKELISQFKIPYEDKESITVNVGYGETKTLNFSGLQAYNGMYYNDVTFLTIKDWYLEPLPHDAKYLTALEDKTDNPRMIIHSSQGTCNFSIDSIPDPFSCLIAPEYTGGILYNGKGYSTAGDLLFSFNDYMNTPFFGDNRYLLLDWNPLSQKEYFAVKFDIQSSRSNEGELKCFAKLYNINENGVMWDASPDVYTAIKNKGIELTSNDRIDSVCVVSKIDGVFKYKVSGMQYSGNILDFTISLNTNKHIVTIE
ncbi:MAG: hypothetical protein SPF15_04925 [Candidatus Cryptobacteroides sp.]|uniref:hypothetical protein n=1 Tax=Candidatus Cryptobacteroides sp. TaxID=2952915 RepID=UPI002A814983|nr:hypothetical protein [Candidatus Cryptobacteroides sp.]MDY5043330.1 hypothetical protein [Candidatus Cryptobacteroides sp.]